MRVWLGVVTLFLRAVDRVVGVWWAAHSGHASDPADDGPLWTAHAGVKESVHGAGARAVGTVVANRRARAPPRFLLDTSGRGEPPCDLATWGAIPRGPNPVRGVVYFMKAGPGPGPNGNH